MGDHAPVRRLWTAVLCGYLALGATMQELPGYVVSRFGTGPGAAGLAVGIAFGATALTRPFAGRAGDVGRARQAVMLGSGLTSLAALGHLLAPDIGTLLLARLVMGAGEALLFSGALPWVLAGTPADRRGRVSGWFGLSMWSGLAGGVLFAVGAHHLGGPGVVWSLVLALPLCSTALVAMTPSQLRVTDAAPMRSPRDFVPHGVALPGLCLGLAAYGYGTVSALLVLYLGSHAGGQDVCLAVFAVAFLFARTFGSPYVDRFGGALVARTVLVLEAAGLALVAVAGSAPFALVATAITGAGLGVVYPSTSSLTLHRSDASRPGVAMGAMTSFWDLGILVAGPVGGLLAAGLGYPVAFVAAAALVAVAAVLTVRLAQPARRVDHR